ncbi:unnamed protein product [Rotaria sp. Silwood1]|nr:unnamed protein product [Rotaria sp. Silwood1]CAF1327281.1 unnamed protein product [Rotaria sp. Silwood1]CAF3536338.1 unnamed protein product [Rotaria sp. Silwood1]CAF4821895.1 unnamed protein product [Rotaria sp. Silwood1]
MGCIQVKVTPNALEKSNSNVSHVDTVQDISGDLNISKTYSTDVYENPLSIPTKQVVSSIISNESEDLTPHSESVISKTPNKTTESNHYHNTINKEISMEADKSNPLKNIIIASTSIDSNEPPISKENISKSQIKNVNISDIPSVDSNIPVALNESYRIYHPINSPSIHSDTVVYRHNANERLLSATENELDTYQESIHNNDCNESDTSFPIRDSIISTTSIDSEESVTSRIEHYRSIFVRPKHTNLRQRRVSESNESELKHEKRDSSVVVE